jgi:hypothetical protein
MGDCFSQTGYFFRRRIAGLGLLETFERSRHGEKAGQTILLVCVYCRTKARCYWSYVVGARKVKLSAPKRPKMRAASESESLTI